MDMNVTGDTRAPHLSKHFDKTAMANRVFQ